MYWQGADMPTAIVIMHSFMKTQKSAMNRIMFNADGSCDPPIEIRMIAQGHGSTHVGISAIRLDMRILNEKLRL